MTRPTASPPGDEVTFFLRRRGILFFMSGFFLGGSGLTGAALLHWNQSAALPPDPDPKQKRLKQAAATSAVAISGVIRQWVWLWWPHWRVVEAEVQTSLLLLRGASQNTSSVSFTDGPCATALPLSGCTVIRATSTNDLKLSTPSGASETLRLPTPEAQRTWANALNGGSKAVRRRVIDVAYPPTWQPTANAGGLHVMELDKSSSEYKRIEKLAITQQACKPSNPDPNPKQPS